MPAKLGVLYLCYLSLDDPLVHTQVIAYLSGLAERGHRVHLLTFEQRRLARGERRRRRVELSRRGISWHSLRYHKRPSLAATVYDTIAGAAVTCVLTRRHRLDAIHARSHVPAAMALIALRLAGGRRQIIFDIRGLMAEEYEDAGRWRRESLPFRMTKAVERATIRCATANVVLTERVRDQLFGSRPRRPVSVIPCCADLAALGAVSSERDSTRLGLGLEEARVMVYVGKFTGWYMEREMAEFFRVARRVMERLHFLILTQSAPEVMVAELGRVSIPASAYTITSAAPARMGAYLAASDFAIAFIRPCPSKISASPTKIGEYLAAGLPVVSTAGIGDVDRLLDPTIGVLVSQHSQPTYESAVRAIAALVADPEVAERCRAVARRNLSLAEVGIPRYAAIYDDVARARDASLRPAGDVIARPPAAGHARKPGWRSP
ncbi:MAG TPA: glycosyltransferase [Solirubrobacteraceae bacterium]|jgi:glycosyltransferase involved in cell wall biosynthesis|nr:glycosyltransferase [Solirubrobacteraceae bacterium]